MSASEHAASDDIVPELVDLARYPITNLGRGAGAVFLAECQQNMQTNGWCNLDGFIREDALALLNAEANAFLPQAQVLHVKRNIYQGAIDPSLPPDDPRRQEITHIAVQLADDQIPETSRLKRLYRSDLLTDFVRRVQKKAQLYCCADEFQALNIVSLRPGNRHAWHYDTTECTVTLLLQGGRAGW